MSFAALLSNVSSCDDIPDEPITAEEEAEDKRNKPGQHPATKLYKGLMQSLKQKYESDDQVVWLMAKHFEEVKEQIIFMESFKKNTEPILDQYRKLVHRLKYTGRLNDENFAHFRTELESLVKQLLEFDNTWTNSLRRLPKTLGKRFLNKATTVKVQIIKLVKLSGGDVEERELSPVSARKVTKSQLKSGQYVRREILPEQYQDDSRIKNNKRQAEVKKMKSKNTAAAQNLETTRIKQEIPEMRSPLKKQSRSPTYTLEKTKSESLKKEDAPAAVKRRTRSSIAAEAVSNPMSKEEQMEEQTPQERRVSSAKSFEKNENKAPKSKKAKKENTSNHSAFALSKVKQEIEDAPSGLEAEAIQQEERIQGKRGRKLKRALPPKKQISIIPAGSSISTDTMSISSHPDDWDTTNSEFVIYKPRQEADKRSYEKVKNKASASKMAKLDSNGNNSNLALFNVKQEVDEGFELEENTNDHRIEPERQENQLQLELEDESDGPSISTSKSAPPKKKTSKLPVVRAAPTPVAQKPEGRYIKKRAVEDKEAVNEPVTRNSFGRIVKNTYFGDQVIYSDDESDEEEENDDEDEDEPAPKKRRISSAKLAKKPKNKIRRSIKPTQIKGATNTELLLASVKQEIAFGHEVEESEDESCDDDIEIDVESTEPAQRRKKTKSPPVVDPTLVLVPGFKTPETVTEFFEQQLYNNALVYMESFRLNFLNVMTDEGKLELQFVSDVMVDLDKGVAELLKKNYNSYLNYKPLVEAGFKKYLEYVVEEQRNLLAGHYSPSIGSQQIETSTFNSPTNHNDGSPVNLPNISVKIEVE